MLLDVGATLDRNSRFLYEYAVMGAIYSNAIYGVENPSIGLLNVGEEDSKGTSEHLEAYKKLKQSKLNFYGNIEGGDILTGKTDIVITDGFSGNLLLKFAEGFVKIFNEVLTYYATISPSHNENAKLVAPILKDLLSGFDYEIYGGVPLLGVKGSVIIGHGKSTALAIKNMIQSAVTAIDKDVFNKIEIALK